MQLRHIDIANLTVSAANKLDDPSFAAPIYASLVEAEDGEQRLIWSR